MLTTKIFYGIPDTVQHLLSNGVDALVDLEPLVRLSVILAELLSNIGADVSHLLFDGLGCLQTLLWGNPRLSLSQQLLDEVGDVSTGDRDVLDAAADHVAFSLAGGEGGRWEVGGRGRGERGREREGILHTCKDFLSQITSMQ